MARLLVIEDDTHIRNEVMDWFQFEGFDVIGAANGRQGLEAVREHSPDVILCDISMPEMDGHDVLIGLRSNSEYSHIPFIFLTAAADRESMRRGMTLGADDYLTKPFSRDEVLNAVYTRLDMKSAQDERLHTQLDLMDSLLAEERAKLLLKSRLVAIFSHDFRNPLASVLASSNILRNYEDRLTPERKRHQLDRIDGSVQQLLHMLDDMIVVAEVEGGYLQFIPQPLDLNAFVESIIGDFRLIDEDNHPVQFRSLVYGEYELDSKLLRHILTNLISNAIKYSSSGKPISITLDAQDGTLQLVVEDQGIGIPEEGIARLFKAFYRADNAKGIKGTGLGLNIVKECVSQHNGEIKVESAVNQGTRFIVRLPLILASTASAWEGRGFSVEAGQCARPPF
ncbi:MAG: response regulator [Chloroflexi bacterium]|nr:response regulator [Chloroflexota bacterium]